MNQSLTCQAGCWIPFHKGFVDQIVVTKDLGWYLQNIPFSPDWQVGNISMDSNALHLRLNLAWISSMYGMQCAAHLTHTAFFSYARWSTLPCVDFNV